MHELDLRLREGRAILIDGAIGTEIEARGGTMDDSVWCGSVVLTHPDIVRGVHADYARAGAEIHIANTYASAPHALAADGREAQAERINRRAVALLHEGLEQAAPAHRVWRAGSVSTFANLGTAALDSQVVEDSLRRQAAWLVDAGCELLVLEMLFAHHRVIDMALQRELTAIIAADTGVPVWAGVSAKVSCNRKTPYLYGGEDPFDDNGQRTGEDDIRLREAVTALAAGPAQAVGVMHSDVPVVMPMLDLLTELTSLPTFAYPNSGHFQMPHWQFVDIITSADLAAEARRWLEHGVCALGGCCGLGVDHVRALAKVRDADG